MKKRIITIHGQFPACGKSTTVEKIQLSLKNYDLVSTGSIARSIGAQYGFTDKTFDEFPAFAREKQIPYDELIDAKLRELNESGDEIIVDSRLGYHFIPGSFKVALDVSLLTAAKRVQADPKRVSIENKPTLQSVYLKLLRRGKSDRVSYLEKYGTDYTALCNYDFVISTETNRPDVVAKRILDAYITWCVHHLIKTPQ